MGRSKNRRRADSAERAVAMRSVASRLGGLAFKLGAAVAVTCVLFFGGKHLHSWATTSPTFALAKITVRGNVRADGVELTRLAGLARGQNLFSLDVETLQRAVEQHPWVRSAKIRRHFPSSLSIVVEEHEPAAMVSLGELYLLDEQGEPFKKVTAGDALDLPLVTGVTRDEYVGKPEESATRFLKALRTLSAFNDEEISEVRLEGDDVTVVTAKGTELRLGGEVSSEKLARLARVRSELQRRGQRAEVIHLDNRVRPGWVTVKVSSQLSERKQRVD